MATLNLCLRKDRISKKDIGIIQWRITKNQKSAYISTNVYVSVENWNADNGIIEIPKPNRKQKQEARSINRILLNHLFEYRKIVSELEKEFDYYLDELSVYEFRDEFVKKMINKGLSEISHKKVLSVVR